ncbi:MAG: hypothetical protein M3Q76_10280 [Acidobacteriota bacterium]|nr:hypothetical protein [Acidobacteriota bacterium]
MSEAGGNSRSTRASVPFDLAPRRVEQLRPRAGRADINRQHERRRHGTR